MPTRRGRGNAGESPRTDAALLGSIAAGDLGALGELYDRHHADVRCVLERVTRDLQTSTTLYRRRFSLSHSPKGSSVTGRRAHGYAESRCDSHPATSAA